MNMYISFISYLYINTSNDNHYIEVLMYNDYLIINFLIKMPALLLKSNYN